MPQGWTTTTLGKVLAQNGYIRGPFGSALRRNELLDKGVPVYERKCPAIHTLDSGQKKIPVPLRSGIVHGGVMLNSHSAGLCRLPAVRQEFPESGYGHGGQTGKEVL